VAVLESIGKNGGGGVDGAGPATTPHFVNPGNDRELGSIRAQLAFKRPAKGVAALRRHVLIMIFQPRVAMKNRCFPAFAEEIGEETFILMIRTISFMVVACMQNPRQLERKRIA